MRRHVNSDGGGGFGDIIQSFNLHSNSVCESVLSFQKVIYTSLTKSMVCIIPSA